MRRLLAGSYLWQPGAARNLQDPLTFRCAWGVDGALWDALDYARRVLAAELDSGQGNPVVIVSEDRVVSVGNFELQTLTAALDLARISLATALTSSQERSIKLLDAQWSGLPTGLVGDAEASDSGLAMYQILVQRLVAEARVLAHPVSMEGPSTSCAEGIEDRYNWTSLAAGKLDEVVRLGELVVAVELLVGTQASELREKTPLGDGTGEIVRAVRELVPFATATEATPSDLDGLTALIRARTLSPSSAAQEE
jgi:histidine ammonia-lyase